MITIYYPYWEAGSSWNELRYSLRSLEKHLKSPFEIVFVGDKPDWVQNVTHIPYTRDNTKTSLWNTLRMMELFLEYQLRSGFQCDQFIRMYDDVYFLRDMTVEELKVTRVIRTPEEVMSIASGGEIWRKQIFATVDELHQREYLGYLTESHCPEVFSVRKMNLVYSVFELAEKELLTSTLYYNIFPYAHRITDKKTQRALFYNEENDYSFSSDNVAQKCQDKYFLNHNDQGLNRELKEFIESRFPNRSRFEI